MAFYVYRKYMAIHMSRTMIAGIFLLKGSLILRCIMIAPNIIIASPIAAGSTRYSREIPVSKAMASVIFINHTMYTITSGRP